MTTPVGSRHRELRGGTARVHEILRLHVVPVSAERRPVTTVTLEDGQYRRNVSSRRVECEDDPTPAKFGDETVPVVGVPRQQSLDHPAQYGPHPVPHQCGIQSFRAALTLEHPHVVDRDRLVVQQLADGCNAVNAVIKNTKETIPGGQDKRGTLVDVYDVRMFTLCCDNVVVSGTEHVDDPFLIRGSQSGDRELMPVVDLGPARTYTHSSLTRPEYARGVAAGIRPIVNRIRPCEPVRRTLHQSVRSRP